MIEILYNSRNTLPTWVLWCHADSFKSAKVEYLHRGNKQTLHIRAPPFLTSTSPRPLVKLWPAHHCLNPPFGKSEPPTHWLLVILYLSTYKASLPQRLPPKGVCSGDTKNSPWSYVFALLLSPFSHYHLLWPKGAVFWLFISPTAYPYTLKINIHGLTSPLWYSSPKPINLV